MPEQTLPEMLERLRAAVKRYTFKQGPVHDWGCPCDDTCKCSWRDTLDCLKEKTFAQIAAEYERDILSVSHPGMDWMERALEAERERDTLRAEVEHLQLWQKQQMERCWAMAKDVGIERAKSYAPAAICKMLAKGFEYLRARVESSERALRRIATPERHYEGVSFTTCSDLSEIARVALASLDGVKTGLEK